MTVEHFKSGMDVSGFYECSPLSEQEVKGYKLTDKYLGIWTKRDCPENFEFDENKQRCIENRKLRRQQAACGANPGSQGCQSPCLGNDLQISHLLIIVHIGWDKCDIISYTNQSVREN